MLYSKQELLSFSQNLINQISSADSGNSTDLAYSINDLPDANLVSQGDPFQVIMIGGSHVESAIIKFDNSKPEILSFYDEDMPVIATKEILLNIFDKALDSKTEIIGLNFAYPLKPILRDGLLDGILLSGTKQHTFDGFVGSTVGLELEKFVFQKYNRKIKVTVCNDTVALGLASIDYKKGYNHTNSFFGVVGTGFNFGMFRNSKQVVNLESGNFSGFEQSHTGKIIDSLSTNYRKQKLEKEVGGAYLSSHFNILANLEGLNQHSNSTKELSHIAQNSSDKASKLALDIYNRAASMVAMHIRSVFMFKAQQQKIIPREFKAMVILEGSLFWKGYKFKELTESCLLELGFLEGQITIEHFEKIGIKGAAKLMCIKG
jgi:hexokinase